MTGYLERFRMCQDMLEDLLALDEGLTDWEVDFIEDISQRLDRNPLEVLSDKQMKKIEDIYKVRT